MKYLRTSSCPVLEPTSMPQNFILLLRRVGQSQCLGVPWSHSFVHPLEYLGPFGSLKTPWFTASCLINDSNIHEELSEESKLVPFRKIIVGLVGETQEWMNWAEEKHSKNRRRYSGSMGKIFLFSVWLTIMLLTILTVKYRSPIWDFTTPYVKKLFFHKWGFWCWKFIKYYLMKLPVETNYWNYQRSK